MDFATATEDEIRAFLVMCLTPKGREPRTPQALAEILPVPLRANLHGKAPHLARLHAAAQRAKAEAAITADAYAGALAAWIANDPYSELCPQNRRGDNAVPQPHAFTADTGLCLFCREADPERNVPQPAYATPDDRVWSLAAERDENGAPLYEAPFVGTLYTALALEALYGQIRVIAPEYVFNADSVNRSTKHVPDGAGRTRCHRQFRASRPIEQDEAALLALCGGCRDAVLTGLPA